MLPRLLPLALLFASLPFACGGASGSPSSPSAHDAGADTTALAPPDGAAGCVPGTSITCGGPAGCTGYQVCTTAGTSFGPCMCPSLDGGAGDGDATLSDSGGGMDASANDSPSDAPGDAPVTGAAVLHGAIQKGPFILGSSVTLSSIDATGASTGQVFGTQTTDDLGDFSITFDYRGYVDVQASGFYYDEVTGALSGAPLELRALYDVTSGGAQSAYVNIVTHLAHDRALSLMRGGAMTLEAAEAQAEGELVAALGLGGAGFALGAPGITLNELGSSSLSNAYLFALSAVLVQAATAQAGDGGSVDAQVQELVDTIASDLVPAGTLPAGVTAQLQAAQQSLDVDLTTDLFFYRLQSIGSALLPADLNLVVDSDGDGVPNASDTCPLVANADQGTIPAGALCRETRHTTLVAPISSEFTENPILGDFTNSGHLGVVGYGFNGMLNKLSLALGDGSGRFASPTSISRPSYATVAFDLDQDGNLDLVTADGWSPGDGTGTFGAVASFPDPTTAPDGGATPPVYYLTVAFGDFNQDGVPDLIRDCWDANTNAPLGFAVTLGTGKGHFAASTLTPRPSPAPPQGDYSVWFYPTDLNGDGKQDVATAWQDQGGLLIYAASLLGDGTGGFAATASTTLIGSGGGASFGDFDGDGLLDVEAWASGATPSVAVAFGDGTGTFGSPVVTSLNISESGQVLAGDFNADGMTDLISINADAASYLLGDVDVVLSLGRTFGGPQRLRSSSIYLGGPGLGWATGDVNGDGVPDAVLVSGATGGQWTIQAFLMNVLQ